MEPSRSHIGRWPPFTVWAAMSVATLAPGMLVACAETSLNEAPIVDLSTRAGPPLQTIRGLPAQGSGTGREAGGIWYTVQKGDTLFRIATTFHCTVGDLMRWNQLPESAVIAVGQRLRVSAPAEQAAQAAVATGVAGVAPGEDASPSEAEVNTVALPPSGGMETRPLEAMAGAAPSVPEAPASASASVASAAPVPAVPVPEGAAPVATIAPPEAVAASAPATAGSIWVWPVAGKLHSKFDPEHSKKIEIDVADNADVVAVADGEVSYTGAPRDYGNLIIVRHPDGLLSVYAHLKAIGVKQGQAVSRGQSIGTAGKTGSGASILHFEVRRKGVAVNPMELLPAR